MKLRTDDMSAVQRIEAGMRRRRWRWALAILVLVILLGIYLYGHFSPINKTESYANDLDHFKYGSIGSESENGLPVAVWKALPKLYPEVFKGSDFSVFGFLYETAPDGRRNDLPIGISRRTVYGIEVGWLNCAVCHTGTVREQPGGPRRVIAGMPANNLDLYRFVQFILSMADDPRMKADSLIPAMEKTGTQMDWIDRLTWRYVIIPRIQSTLAERRERLAPLLAAQPPWGPGRVDTFNPYKLIQFHMSFAGLSETERIGTSDFPAIFNQAPREGMHLHWDGNNTSLAERNLSAALGAGVTEQTVEHGNVERVAAWLMYLPAPPSPYHPDATKVAEGRGIYMQYCAACHGHQEPGGYVFQGDWLGQVEPNAKLHVDPARLNSYTEALSEKQKGLFYDDPRYRFRHFQKTDGYANQPLDALWLRAPYLHNGSVPTLHDLLLPAEQRPKTFVRGIDLLDPDKGGFQAPPCTPGQEIDAGLCYDTAQIGNSNSGHEYGTSLDADDKDKLLAYLLTF